MTKFYYYKSKLTGHYLQETKKITGEMFSKYFVEVTEEEFRQHIRNSLKGIN